MTEVQKTITPPGTEISKLLVSRGILRFRKFGEIGKIQCLLNNFLTVSTLVISFESGGSTETIHGIRLEELDEEGNPDDICFLDFKEGPELVAAIDHLMGYAKELSHEYQEYIEADYVSLDGARIGFYHSGNDQTAFADVGGDGQLVYMQIHQLLELKEHLKNTIAALEAGGATV